jgi:hypothetical protein
VEVAKVKKRTGLTGVRNTGPVKSGNRTVSKAKSKGKGTTMGKAKVKVKDKVKVKVKVNVKKQDPIARPPERKTAKRVASTRRARLAVVAGKGGKAGKTGKARKALPPAPVVRVAVKALDPLRKCGLGTTVQLLYRVDETVDGRSTPHLVFFDRHGWYCEHGRNCPAVGHARKHKGHIARVS